MGKYAQQTIDTQQTIGANGDGYSDNTVIVKYNSVGNAQWARSVTIGQGDSSFVGVSSVFAGSICAVGWIWGTSAYGFGNGVTVSGVWTTSNVVIVKYLSECS